MPQTLWKLAAPGAAIGLMLLGWGAGVATAQDGGAKSAARETYADTRALIHPDAIPDAEPGRAGAERSISCDPNAFPEGESNCGLDSNGLPHDTLNGGCSSEFQYFFPTFCGDLICGTSAWNGVSRDTDWYELTIYSQQTLTWEVTPDFDAIIGLAGGTDGQPDCQAVTGINPFRYIPRGETGSVSVCLTPGTWWFVVLPDLSQVPFQCGRQYEASLTCAAGCPEGACCFNGLCDNGYTQSECASLGGLYLGNSTTCAVGSCMPPPNDDICNAQTIVPGEDVIADLRNATLEQWNELPPCALPGGVASVWYTFQGNGEKIKISTCNSEAIDPRATDSVIAVYAGGCQDAPQFLNFLTCNDDAGCGGTGRLSSMCTFATLPNTSYFIQVLAWSEDTRGRYAVETDYPCVAPDPTGACCIPTTFGPFCDEVEESVCGEYDGVFYPGGSCNTTNCDGVEIPANDECDGAIFLQIPSSELGDTTFATPETINTDCGLELQSGGVWYAVIGTGNTITADLCSGNTLFDARLHVFCNNCGSDFVCVGANDDALDAGCGTRPSVSWCSNAGSTYYILVTGTSGADGLFEINVDDDGTSCSNPASCASQCSVTCPPGSTSENEPPCSTGYDDLVNPGCGADPPVYGIIAPGQTICGTSGTFSKNGNPAHDVDWFEFSIEQQCDVTWTVSAEFLVETFILTHECGTGLASYAEGRGNACQGVVVQTTLEPGDYTLLVQPQFYDGVGCGAAWVGTLECVPTASNGACCLDESTCIDTTEAYCNSIGGGFGEIGMPCSQITCAPVGSCQADFDNSGLVEVADFGIMATHFGEGPGATHAEGDATGDGYVNVFDYGVMATEFGNHCN